MLTESRQHEHWTPVGRMLRGAHSIHADTRMIWGVALEVFSCTFTPSLHTAPGQRNRGDSHETAPQPHCTTEVRHPRENRERHVPR